MDEPPPDIRGIANAYGFGLQLAVENAVANGSADWTVNVTEYGWRDENEPKFVDLVVSHRKGGRHLVVECKRAQGGAWVFLVPKSGSPRLEIRALTTSDAVVGGKRQTIAEVLDLYSEPESPRALFCAVRGGGERDRPMLDHVCAELVRSVDAIAEQQLVVEAVLRDSGDYQPVLRNIYLPVIVTTATLHICRVDPASLPLETGMIPSDALLETVSFIRYQKSFGLAELPKLSPGDTLGTLGKHAERTVMIVNATAFPAWLRKLGMWGNHGWTFSM